MSPEATRLVEGNMRLVHYLARKHFRHSPLEYEDLIQEGMIGLMRAANTYQSDQGAAFSTWAAVCIRCNMEHARRKCIRTKDIPVNMKLSLDAPVRAGMDACMAEIIPDSSVGVETVVEQRLEAQRVMDLIGRLPTMERRALELTAFDELRQVEIGRILGCSQTHISRLVKRARTQLTETLEGGHNAVLSYLP